ncbi:transglycosylase SLT domain-containing protein, partial [Acetobacter oeni]|uniref:transglycosylase SLT domain-containing protein n=1 Tax=Acetobacter oeni TaxID=304077 RepID=UPI0021569880
MPDAAPAPAGTAAASPASPALPAAPVSPFPLQRGFLSPGDTGLCTQAALAAEHSTHIPDQFLVAMGRVESGRHLPDGELVAWPWTVNAQGKGYVYDTKQQAIEAVRDFQSRGIRSIDVGCLQVNLQQHADAFPSLEAAFDPMTNARFAARFLVDLFGRTGSWPRAAAAYHSFTPDIGTAYQWKVLESWAAPADGFTGHGGTSASRPSGHSTPFAHGPQPVVAYSTQAGALASARAMSGAKSSGGGGAAQPSSSESTIHPGVHGYNPPPSRPTTAGGSGRTLASYRASPIHMLRQAMNNPARF